MENIDDIIDLLTETGGGHAVGEGNIKDAVVMLLQMKEAAAAPDPTNWQEKSRQLLAETEAETTRLLATKFIADEAVGLAGELTAACREAFLLLSNMPPENTETKAGLKAHSARFNCLDTLYETLAKAAQFTAAGTGPSVGGATEPVIFPPGEVEAVPEHEPNYEPNWPGVIDWFNALAVNKDGEVWAHVSSPEIDGDVWESDEKYLFDTIAPPPGETWQKMVYKRPE